MPRLTPDFVFNGTPLPQSVQIAGAYYTFQPYAMSEFSFSDDLKTQIGACERVRADLGPLGVHVLTEAEQDAMFDNPKAFLDRIETECGNRFLDAWTTEFEVRHATDNAQRMAQNQDPKPLSPLCQRMLRIRDAVAKDLGRRKAITEEQQLIDVLDRVANRPDIPPSVQNILELRSRASKMGAKGVSTWTKGELVKYIEEVLNAKPADAAPQGTVQPQQAAAAMTTAPNPAVDEVVTVPAATATEDLAEV